MWAWCGSSVCRTPRLQRLQRRWTLVENIVRETIDLMPSEPGQSSDDVGYQQLCVRWNREEAEAVAKAKRTLQSPNTTSEQKLRGIDELEYWAIRRGGYDAEIVLIGTLHDPDRLLAGQAHVSLKKTWASHFNAWVNSAVTRAKTLQSKGEVEGALAILNKTIFENPLWGEGYHLRASVWNQLKDTNRTVQDLRSALEFCPNNYLVMIELGITLMDKMQMYDEAANLFETASDLCPILPISAFTCSLYEKAPHLRPLPELAFSLDAIPPRLMPDNWIERKEATERPNQAFLRVGAVMEQWFTEMQRHHPSAKAQRRLWSKLVIAWDPDKHPRPLKSFTEQVHDLLKARRERELAKASAQPEQSVLAADPRDDAYEDDADAAAFLRNLRSARRR